MNKPKLIGKVVIPIYKHTICVYIGMPEDIKPLEQARCEILFDKLQVNMYFKSIDTHSENIIHEIVHAVDFILYNCGADMGTSKGDSEIRAYLTGYVWTRVGTIMHRIQKTALNLAPIVESAIDLGIQVEKHKQKERENGKTQTRKSDVKGSTQKRKQKK